MTTGEAIVKKAREFIGTPFRHAHMSRGIGVDCVGLALGVAHELELTDYVPVPYSPEVDPEFLKAEISKLCDRVLGPPEPGDLILFRIQGNPQHVGIFTGSTLIHAFEQANAVVEVTWNSYWARKTEAVYRWRQ